MKIFKNKKNIVKKWMFFLGSRGKRIFINFRNFLNEEIIEIKELASGKEGLKKFCCDSGSIFKDYFIPNEGNDHRPKILRTKSLAIIAAILIIIKMSIAGYLFFIYPNQAKMSELITKNVLELINIDRKNNGLSELSSNPILNKAAISKAQDMVEKSYFAHKSPDGHMAWDFIDRSEYTYLFVGENLAMNFTSAQTAHKALMLSEGHKKNILNNKYSDIGLAVLTGVINKKKTNVLVQIFGVASDVKLAIISETDKKANEKPAEILPVNKIKQEIKTENPQNKDTGIVKKETKEIEKIEKAEKTEAIEKIEEIEKTEEIEKIENKAIKTPVEKDITKVKSAPVLSIEDKNIDADFNEAKANLNNEIKFFKVESDKKMGILAKTAKVSHYIFFIALMIITFSLLINIFIKFRIQHKMLIAETVLVIIFIISLIYVKINFLGYVMEKVFII